ncbi:hypothetical protein [Inquilinus limosus]|uniref:hypothetical protein n=1 Tax=Inquilinus limosus TaxID=171674 RepID=UPI00126A5366|nr:hypothetical protein [Inquilinus limosus]
MAYCITFTVINKTGWGISSNGYDSNTSITVPVCDSIPGGGAGFCVVVAGDGGSDFNGDIQYTVDDGAYDLFNVSFDYVNRTLKPVILSSKQSYNVSVSDVGFGIAGNLYGTFTVTSG